MATRSPISTEASDPAEASALQRELGQPRPFHSLRQEATIGILRTADVLRRRFTAILEPRGLTVQQFNVLRILRGALPDALPTMEIAERMFERTPGITRLIDRLEAKGLVARTRRQDDRRCVLCSITPAGLDLLAPLDEPISRADDEALAMLRTPELERLIALLDRVRAEQPGPVPET